MEISLYSVRGEWDCGRKAILNVKEPLDAGDISTAPHRAHLWHPVAFEQLGYAGELPPPVSAEHGFANFVVGRKKGQPVPGKGGAGHQTLD
jgi:hypothetical protein